ncbi:MAG: DNA primase [Deltaproteobacteria bacterium]|nr:DNA primase [Deltaproteobacteria bacterium]MBT7204239.1 DNA primase [Deltaproteobacteria bacterium]
MRFSDDFVREVVNRTDLVQLMEERGVALRRTGSTFKACCPFHSEKTPSFNVNPQRGFFHCFGCGTSGDAIRFLMLFERLTFAEAVTDLANKAGVELRHEGKSNQRKPDQEAGLHALQLASDFYQQQLQGPTGQNVCTYLDQRYVPAEWQERFQLGFAPDDWQRLHQYLLAQKIPAQIQEQCGLVKMAEQQERRYDRFRNRLIFPIRDARGRCIGFGGRVIRSEDQPKYLNSPETPYYRKSQVLYGLYEGLETIRRSQELIFVEGYLDVIRMHQYGFAQAVATCGTALTPEHLQLIRRHANSVVLLFDGDAAGQKAALKNCQLFLPVPLDTYILTLPENEDPDSFLQNKGKEAFSKLLARKQPLLEYLIRQTLAKYPETVPGRQEALRELLVAAQPIHKLEQRQMVWVQIAEALRLPNETVFAAAKTLTNFSKNNRITGFSNTVMRKSPHSPDERFLLQALLTEAQLMSLAKQFLRPEDFRHSLYRQLYEQLLQLPDDASSAHLPQQFAKEQPELARELAALYATDFLHEHLESQFRLSLRRLKERHLREYRQERLQSVAPNSTEHALLGRTLRQMEEELNRIFKPR